MRRRFLIAGLGLSLLAVSTGGWMWYKSGNRFTGDIRPETTTDYRVEYQDYTKFLHVMESWGVFGQEVWKVPGGPVLRGRVTEVMVKVTTEVQPYNREDTPNGPVGSVNVELVGTTLVITVQTTPSVWERLDRNWHVESQFLRVVNDMAQNDYKKSNRQLVREFAGQERLITIHDN